MKQMSLVLEASNDFDELELIGSLKKFLYDYDVQVIGTHVKIIK